MATKNLTRKRWTPDEDAVVRKHRDKGPSWEGYAALLPDRTPASIAFRRKQLGVKFSRAGRQAVKRKAIEVARNARAEQVKQSKKQGKQHGKKRDQPPLSAGEPWSQAQDEALVACVVDMTERCGHTVGECATRFAQLIAEMRASKSV